MNQSTPLASTQIPFNLAVFRSLDDSRRQPKPIEFCAEK
jgi:hypothetical protein